MSRDKYAYAQELCHKKAGMVLMRTNALWPGCRVGVAVSGGVDSMTLLKVMLIRRSIVPFPFELMAIHLNPGFDVASHKPLLGYLTSLGIAGHIEITDYGPRAHSEENRKRSPCFYCAWLRRKRLFDLCRRYHLTHLALGHNADDLTTTFMLNTLRNGKVQGMGLNESFFGGSLRVIRPMLLVEKKYIIQASRQWDLPTWRNSCPSAGRTSRQEMAQILSVIAERLPHAPQSLTAALCRWQLGRDSCEEYADTEPGR